MAVKAIIFDLGGVVLDIDSERENQRFAELGIENYRKFFTPANMNVFFQKQEVGEVLEDQFYDGFRQLTGSSLSDRDIKETWNLILTDFNSARMAYLEKLRQRFPIYLFSNTNDIHTRRFEALCLEQMGKPLSDYFEQLYYSQEIHMRKPNPQAFQKVLDLSGLKAEETVFIDDNADNVAGAKSVGLQTIHLVAPTTILDLTFE